MNLNDWDASPNWEKRLFDDLTGYRDSDYAPFFSNTTGSIRLGTGNTGGETAGGTTTPPTSRPTLNTIDPCKAPKSSLLYQTKCMNKGGSTPPASTADVNTSPSNTKTLGSTAPAPTIVYRQSAPTIVTVPVISGGGGGGGGVPSEPVAEPIKETTDPSKSNTNKKLLAIGAIAVAAWYFIK